MVSSFGKKTESKMPDRWNLEKRKKRGGGGNGEK